MASNFTTLYQKVRTTIPLLTGFSTKTEIPYPYELSSNNAHFLRDGWCIKVGEATPDTATYLVPEYTLLQSFEIILTRYVPTLDSDPALIVAAVGTLRDDLNIIEKDFTGSRFSNADKVHNVIINSITGIDNVTSGKFKHIKASIILDFLHWR